jgi:hypothetical protein
MSLLPVLRAWFFGTVDPPTDIPAGRRSIAAVPHRRTAVLERGRTITLTTHRRTAEVAR